MSRIFAAAAATLLLFSILETPSFAGTSEGFRSAERERYAHMTLIPPNADLKSFSTDYSALLDQSEQGIVIPSYRLTDALSEMLQVGPVTAIRRGQEIVLAPQSLRAGSKIRVIPLDDRRAPRLIALTALTALRLKRNIDNGDLGSAYALLQRRFDDDAAAARESSPLVFASNQTSLPGLLRRLRAPRPDDTRRNEATLQLQAMLDVKDRVDEPPTSSSSERSSLWKRWALKFGLGSLMNSAFSVPALADRAGTVDINSPSEISLIVVAGAAALALIAAAHLLYGRVRPRQEQARSDRMKEFARDQRKLSRNIAVLDFLPKIVIALLLVGVVTGKSWVTDQIMFWAMVPLVLLLFFFARQAFGIQNKRIRTMDRQEIAGLHHAYDGLQAKSAMEAELDHLLSTTGPLFDGLIADLRKLPEAERNLIESEIEEIQDFVARARAGELRGWTTPAIATWLIGATMKPMSVYVRVRGADPRVDRLRSALRAAIQSK